MDHNNLNKCSKMMDVITYLLLLAIMPVGEIAFTVDRGNNLRSMIITLVLSCWWIAIVVWAVHRWLELQDLEVELQNRQEREKMRAKALARREGRRLRFEARASASARLKAGRVTKQEDAFQNFLQINNLQ